MIDADLVISTTAAPEPIVTLEQYMRVQRARRNRLALILDIAIPRDFDPRIGEPRPGDALPRRRLREPRPSKTGSKAEGNRPRHGDHRPRTAALLASLRHQHAAGLLLQQLGNHADQIRQRELDALFATRPNLPDADRTAIAHMAMRLQNQFLHHPRAAVRSVVTEPHHEHGRPHPVLSFIRQIFHLGEPSQSSSHVKS